MVFLPAEYMVVVPHILCDKTRVLQMNLTVLLSNRGVARTSCLTFLRIGVKYVMLSVFLVPLVPTLRIGHAEGVV